MNGRLQKFEPASPILPPFEEWCRRNQASGLLAGAPDDAMRALYAQASSDAIFLNDEYQVSIDKNAPHTFGVDAEIWHLSIKRRNKNPAHDWRDLQAIKNALVGPKFEAIELYPASSRVIDTANQFHLWVFVKLGGQVAPLLPVGWHAGRSVVSHPGGNAKQRRLDGEGASL